MTAANTSRLRQGMHVYSGEGKPIGQIEQFDRDTMTVEGQQFDATSITRIEGDRVYLAPRTRARGDTGYEAGMAGRTGEVVRPQGEVRVPEVEERLDVEKRQADIGEVRVRKTVEEVRQTVPVDLERDEVRVDRRDIPDRPIGPGEAQDAFSEGTVRVPVRGEEAVVHKEAVVTGEVVLNKERTVERQELGDTVRRTHVEVNDQQPREPRAGARASASSASTTDTDTQRLRNAQGTAQGTSPTGGVPRDQITMGLAVFSSDGEDLGTVKELRGQDFVLDRPLQRDLIVPMSAITQVDRGRVMLNARADQIDDMDWPNPPLM